MSKRSHHNGHSHDHEDHDHPHGHSHGQVGHGGNGHTHGVVDPSITTSEKGIWAIKWSFVFLVITALIQVVVVWLSGSVALLADTIHNFGDGMPFRDGEVRSNRNVQFSVQTVAYPSGPYLRYLPDARGTASRFSNSVNNVRLDSIQHSGEHGLARLPHDLNDNNGYEKSDDGVSQRISKPNTDRAEYYG